jgi:cytochrome c oxidase subunit 3
MSETPEPSDSRYPERYPDATGKGDIHIPGAGTFGMALLLVSLSVLFLASMVGYIVIRVRTDPWPPAGFPHVPNSLWISTAVILCASVTIQRALRAVRRDDERRLGRALLATFFIGILFLGLQGLNWVEFYLSIKPPYQVQGQFYLVMFFILTALHGAHVIGGLIPLGIVIARAKKGRYSRNFHPGVRYLALYWHFLDVVWVVLFMLIYF